MEEEGKLYLIRSFTATRSILKVGYSTDIPHRLEHYFYANPGVELVSTRVGNKLLEYKIHIYLKFLGYQYQRYGKLNEWFVDNLEVQRIFHIHQGRLDKEIWKNRENILNLEKSIDLSIYERLKNKNLSSYTGDRYEVIKQGKLVLKNYNKLDAMYQETILPKKEPIDNSIIMDEERSEDNKIIEDFIELFTSTGNFSKKMRAYCDFVDEHKNDDYILSIINAKITDPKYKSYYNLLGTAGCRARNYREDLIKRELGDHMSKDTLSAEIYRVFKVGDRILRRDIKVMLSEIYKALGINAVPKAIDLGKWFDMTDIRIISPGGKREAGFFLAAIKKGGDF